MAEFDNRILIGIFGAIIGVYGWLLKHLSSAKKHPCTDKLVYKDVCESERRRLDDCIEAEVRRSTERYKALEKSIDELKQMVRNGSRR